MAGQLPVIDGKQVIRVLYAQASSSTASPGVIT
jgi:hypothetical protein